MDRMTQERYAYLRDGFLYILDKRPDSKVAKGMRELCLEIEAAWKELDYLQMQVDDTATLIPDFEKEIATLKAQVEEAMNKKVQVSNKQEIIMDCLKDGMDRAIEEAEEN